MTERGCHCRTPVEMVTYRRSRIDGLCEFLSRYRLRIFVLILILTGFFLYGVSQIRGEVIIQELFPYDHPYLKLQGRFAKVFGSGSSGVVIAIKAKRGDIFAPTILNKIKNATEEVRLWEEVYPSLTLSIASRSAKVVQTHDKGEIHISPLMWPDVPQDADGIALLKQSIFSSPAYAGTLVSNDGTAALISAEFKDNISYERAFSRLRHLTHTYTDDETSLHIIGFPMLMGWIYHLKPQLYTVFAISVCSIGLMLYLIFRNLAGLLAPLVNALILTIWGLGFIGFSGVNFNPLLYVLAFLVGARMIGNAYQITYRYFEELHASDGNRRRASDATMRAMFVPNVAAVFTDAAGFLVLILAKIVLLQHLALIMTFWMMSIILTGFIVPTVCSIIPLRSTGEGWAKVPAQVNRQVRVIRRITHFALGPRTRYPFMAFIVLLTIFCIWQVSKLKMGDPTAGSPLLWRSHPYNQDQALINRLFDFSSENLVLYYEGKRMSVYEPIVLRTFEAFARYMQERLPDIYKSSGSVIDLVKMLNLTLHDGDEAWYQLPHQRSLSGALTSYVRGNIADVNTFGRYIDRTFESAQITLYFADHTSENLLRIRDAAKDFFKAYPMQVAQGAFELAGGRIGMEIALNETMKRSHVVIDLTVLAAIFMLCALSYRSLTAGLMLTLPLILSNSVAGAYMALADIGLSINTLPIAALGVGLGVDFAIYFYSRCQEEFSLQEGSWEKTIIQSICTCGKAVVYTGLTMMLPAISWYFFSDMKFQAQVGGFLALIIGTNVMLTLTLHPLLIYIIKPAFISRRVASTTLQG